MTQWSWYRIRWVIFNSIKSILFAVFPEKKRFFHFCLLNFLLHRVIFFDKAMFNDFLLNWPVHKYALTNMIANTTKSWKTKSKSNKNTFYVYLLMVWPKETRTR